MGILERLDVMADQLERASLVQDHSVHIIKQVCSLNYREAQAIRAVVATLLKACEAAREWAASYPLGAGYDNCAANDVYEKTNAAIVQAGGGHNEDVP